ncbi:MAG: HAD family hydrolase [Bdellovibrionales bacterium]|nr:HAD family hydrolase [Bdellovibrionales bacterium]
MSLQKRAVFFDRDGTLIEDKLYLNDPHQIVYLPGVFESLRRLRDGGFHFVVVTNQSGVPRGLVDVGNLRQIHELIRGEFASQGIDILSFHDAPFMTDSNHYFRKPNPGMVLEGARFYNIDLKSSWIVGDRMSDVEAGHRAGTRAVLLGSLESPLGSEFAPPEAHVQTLPEVADFILRHTERAD